MRLLATLLTYVVFCLAIPVLLLFAKIREGIAARLGIYPRGWPQLDEGPRVWLHGASAGDVLALMPLVRELRDQVPDVQIILSTITNSGRAMATRDAECFATITYLPYDLPGAVRRALRRIRPDVLVLEYTELWPQLIHAAARRGVALVLHNGRFSQQRLGRYRWLFFFFGNLLARFSLLLMRDERESDAALALGARQEQIRVTGNTKFDNLARDPPQGKVRELRAAAALSEDDLVWVAGSTHEGEEELLLDVFVELRQHLRQLRMIIAPRYAERAERIRQMASKRRLTSRARSVPGDTVDVLVIDTIGELSAVYQLASVVFVGGSFIARGGQNILEPAACGKPVLFGPHMENFADSVQVLLGRGGVQVAHPTQLRRVLADLLAWPASREELGSMAAAQVRRVRGTARRNALLIAELLAAQRQPTR